jgi:phosphoribosylglycinamide formyltransferase 1
MIRVYARKKVVSFLVSGSGLNFSVVAKKIINKEIRARIGAVVTDTKKARVIGRAGSLGVPAFFVDPKKYHERDEFEQEIIRIFARYRTDLIVAAGYLRLLSSGFVNRYRNRIINIHPSLLPAFSGMHSQKKTLESGTRITGCTAYFIDEGIDTGPIIIQSPVAVYDHDTVESLSARILKEEYRVLPEAVRLFCDGKLNVCGNRVVICP